MSDLPAVRVLLEQYLDVEKEKYECMVNDEGEKKFSELEVKQEEISKNMLQKNTNIKHVKTALTIKKQSIDAEIQAVKDYINQLQKAKAFINKSEKKLDHLTRQIVYELGTINENGSTTLTTDIGRYTAYVRRGSVNILNEELMPQSFIKTKTTTSIDKAALRKHLLAKGDQVYAELENVPSLKIS